MRVLVRRGILRLPLGSIARDLDDRCHGIARATPDAVRRALLADNALNDDLVQELTIVLWHGVRSGRVPATRGSVGAWLRTSAKFIVPRHAREAATLLLLAALSDDTVEVEVPVAPPAEFFGATALTERDRYALLAREPGRRALLTPGERDVLDRWLAGARLVDIAKALGITDRAARLRLMRARRRLDLRAKTPARNDPPKGRTSKS